jgi:signal transduction histidine kinase
VTLLPDHVRGFRARLVAAFALAVSVALALVLVALPPLLDDYFTRQDRQNLQARADAMAQLVRTQLLQFTTREPEIPLPILSTKGEASASDSVYRALELSGFVAAQSRSVAQADTVVTLARSEDEPQPVYRLKVPLDPEAGQPGQTREPLTATSSVLVPDLFFTTTPETAPKRLLTVELSDPFTYRAQTSATITSVLLGAAAVALIVAIVASVLLAQLLTGPVRRLTRAARALGEGRLGVRVPTASAGSPEVEELARAFNTMAERLQESIEVISQDRDRSREFLADVSHELRTPIAALRTFNELLQGGAADDPATRDEFLEQSRRQIERLDWLATNLLELSKLDSGLVSLDMRPDDLRAVVENAVEQAEPVARRKDVELVAHVPPTPVRQPHDPPRLGQVLSNLIGNAIKFTPSGGRIDVDLAATPDGARIAVSDTGAGIAADELPHVFERFWRGTRTPEERGTGSGLGLAIVKSIVEMHEGTVGIESSPGGGTRVTVELPRSVSVSSPVEGRS